MTSCGEAQLGDTSCARFARIATTEEQRAALKADRTLWETLVNQVVAHNRMFASTCGD